MSMSTPINQIRSRLTAPGGNAAIGGGMGNGQMIYDPNPPPPTPRHVTRPKW